MFTGLIESLGTVRSVETRGNYRVIKIAPDSSFRDMERGESIAVSGPCLTVVDYDADSFTVEASQETIGITTVKDWKAGDRVNLERALRADSRLGGHFVSGHIDGILKVKDVSRIGESMQITIDLPESYASYVVDRGSVAMDGISLTVIEVNADSFKVNLIPESQERTTWGNLRTGDEINVEFDMIGKYILRFLKGRGTGSRLSLDLMKQMGF